MGEKGDPPLPVAPKEDFRLWERQSPYYLITKCLLRREPYLKQSTIYSSKLQKGYNKIDHVVHECFCLFLSIMPKCVQNDLAPSLPPQSEGRVQKTVEFSDEFLAGRQGGFIQLLSNVFHGVSERKGRICRPD